MSRITEIKRDIVIYQRFDTKERESLILKN